MAEVDTKALAALVKRCAAAMIAEEDRRVEASENPLYVRGICGEWSTAGRKICDEVAGDDLGPICYYLLGGAWNDMLDWVDEQEKK